MINLEQVLRGCKKGERHAQQALYQYYAPTLLALCMRYANNKAEAQDVLQDGFLLIFTKISQFKNEGSFEGWMRKIMVNCALQQYRKQKTQLFIVPQEILENNYIAAETALPQMAEKELLNIIQQLPPAYKTIFNLYVFEGYKHKEIAEILNISEGTSKSNLYDARIFLQKAIYKQLNINNVVNA